MESVPDEITEDDVDEVLNAHEPTGGGRYPARERVEMRRHVLAPRPRYIELFADEKRVFPVTTEHDTERDDA